MGSQLRKVRPFRHVVQLAVILLLVLVAYLSANPMEWSPSRIVLGQVPEPMITDIYGDTWHFKAWDLRLVHPVAFVESAVAFKALYVPMMWAVLLPLGITLVFGRVFCSWLCPVGFLLELNQKLNAGLSRLGIGWRFGIKDIRYTLLGLSLVFAFLFAFPLISVFDPPHVFGRELMYVFAHGQMSMSGVGLLFGILAFETVAVSRAWCNYFCPSGGGLSILGKPRALRIRMHSDACTHCGNCNDACPYHLKPMGLADGERFSWTTCDNCGLCRDSCPVGAIAYSLRWRGGKEH